MEAYIPFEHGAPRTRSSCTKVQSGQPKRTKLLHTSPSQGLV